MKDDEKTHARSHACARTHTHTHTRLPDVDGIRTHNISTDNLSSTPSLLTISNALNFRNGISLDSQSLCRSFPVINISKSRMFIQNHGLLRYKSAIVELKELMIWWSRVFCQERVMIALTAWWSLHYINHFEEHS